jgi:hypothetical protein
MKRILITLVSLLAVVSLVIGASAATAAKPQNSGSGKDVIALSNGFPSGPHFNLNIHGKDPLTFTLPDPLPEPPYGGSIFISEYSPYWDPISEEWIEETIQYESGKRSSVAELEVHDAWSQAIDGDPAVVKLPYEPQGFYVFARIHAKPQNGKDDSQQRSNIILKPNNLVDLQNFVDDGFGGEVAIGLITKDAIYYAGEEQFYRFEDPEAKGKGKSKARDITHLFLYSGWVVDPILDIYPPAVGTTPAGDGVMDDNDVPAIPPVGAYDYDLVSNGGNGDGTIQIDEWLAYNAALATPLAWYFAQEWIFNIADLVITEQGLVNDGTKLLQLRFYPVATTEFRAPGYIIVDKITNPSGDSQSFQFNADYYTEPFYLADADLPNISGPLSDGIYQISELLPADWDLTAIAVLDPDSDLESQGDIVTGTATINLDPGETVRVIFTNTYIPPV